MAKSPMAESMALEMYRKLGGDAVQTVSIGRQNSLHWTLQNFRRQRSFTQSLELVKAAVAACKELPDLPADAIGVVYTGKAPRQIWCAMQICNRKRDGMHNEYLAAGATSSDGSDDDYVDDENDDESSDEDEGCSAGGSGSKVPILGEKDKVKEVLDKLEETMSGGGYDEEDVGLELPGATYGPGDSVWWRPGKLGLNLLGLLITHEIRQRSGGVPKALTAPELKDNKKAPPRKRAKRAKMEAMWFQKTEGSNPIIGVPPVGCHCFGAFRGGVLEGYVEQEEMKARGAEEGQG
jgi:hypothetical protein